MAKEHYPMPERARRLGRPERAKIDPSRLDSRSDRLFRLTKSTQDRSKRLFRPTLSIEVARKGLRRAILAALGSILGALGGRFQCFSDASPHEQADSCEEEATYEKPAKTQVFAGFSHVRSCAHEAKLDRKSIRTHFSTESRDGSPSKVTFFELRSLNMVPRGLSGASRGALERLLGRSWVLLGRSWALLGGSWGALGALLGRSGALLGGT